MAYDKALERVTQALEQGNCGVAIREMETYLAAWPEQHTQEKLDALTAEYAELEREWKNGTKDEERYHALLGRTYVLYANVMHYHWLKASPYLYSLYSRVRQKGRDWSLGAIKQQLEGFVSDVAVLELEPEHTRKEKSNAVYKEHQQWVNQLFEYVLTSRQWTETVGRQFAEMLTSPTVDTMDQQLLVSGVTLAVMNQFDLAKFRMLTEVYRTAQDEAVKQRALIGWALALNGRWQAVYPEQKATVKELLEQEEVCKELTELQAQLVYCMNESKDSNILTNEILPELHAGSEFRLSHLGLIESDEETPLEEILHPEIADERMNRLENLYQRMMDMQKAGSDIFFSGFSHMKRYPFFYDISNWLMPFYIEHPDIRQYVEKLQANRFMQQAMDTSVLCSSDRYSFVIAFQDIANQLPQSLRDMMQRGEASLGELELDDEERRSPTIIRRSYLMDLYRFFRLYPHRAEMSDPFTVEEHHWEFFSSPLLKDTPLDEYKRDVVRLMRKNKYFNSARRVVDTFPEKMHDVEYYLWKDDPYSAFKLYPEDDRVWVALGKSAFKLGLYDLALEVYTALSSNYPENKRYMLNKAVCLVNTEKYDEAVKLLYQLNYEDPENVPAIRALAWALTCQGKTEQADRYYEELRQREAMTDEDRHNYGCNLWLQGRVEQAAEVLKTFDSRDKEWLRQRGISDVDIKMMEALLQM